jgi:hypothetical protein
VSDALTRLGRLLARARVEYAVIGAHAVNAWLEPRLTADVDVTIEAGPEAIRRVKQVFEEEGFTASREQGAELPSGPDFVRLTSADEEVVVELQAAKTGFQREVIRRATGSGLKVATPEDLIVMKLIANRAKDRADLDGLVRLAGIDWAYVERWAAEWEVLELLHQVREAARG